MNCPKRGRAQSESVGSFCSYCGARPTAREWTLNSVSTTGIVLALLLIGGFGSWLIFGHQETSKQITLPMPQTEVSAPTSVNAEKPTPAVPTPSESASPTPSSIKPLVRTFGPYTFRLAAHQSRSIPLTVPESTEPMNLEMGFSSAGGLGGHLRVLVFHDLAKVFDSGEASRTEFSVPVVPGNYSIIIQNNALMLPRDVAMAAKITTFSQ